MGIRWGSCIAIVLTVLMVYVTNLSRVKDDLLGRSIVKKSRENENVVLKYNGQTSVKDTARVPAASSGVGERLDPLKNPVLAEKRRVNQSEKKKFESLSYEKRENINLQLVGNGEWSLFSDLQVSKDPIYDSLFELGSFHVFRKDEKAVENSMGLIIEENQKQLGVLTGRVVVKVRDIIDMNVIARDYGLKVDSVSAEIRTVYLDAVHIATLSKLNETLKADQRVERFYFEVVRTTWVKN